MGPMTFTEFLGALGEEKLKSFIMQYEPDQKIGEVVHKRLLSLLRSYYYIGGMPEAVSVFVDSHSYKDVSKVHNSIIETYQEDFVALGGTQWDLVPSLNAEQKWVDCLADLVSH